MSTTGNGGPGGPNGVVPMLYGLIDAINNGDLRVSDVVSTINSDTKFKQVVIQFRSPGHLRQRGVPNRDVDLIMKPENESGQSVVDGVTKQLEHDDHKVKGF